MTKVCKRHVNNPVMIYHQCVGCELEWFREELEQKQQEIKRLEQERDKLIEVLRWYAEPTNWEYRTSYLDQDAPTLDDCGQRARNILREIWVRVEPDRLHDARVKIAKARFSPERLISEREESGEV